MERSMTAFHLRWLHGILVFLRVRQRKNFSNEICLIVFSFYVCIEMPKVVDFPYKKGSKCWPHFLLPLNFGHWCHCGPPTLHILKADNFLCVRTTFFFFFWRLKANWMPEICCRGHVSVWAEKKTFFFTPLNAHNSKIRVLPRAGKGLKIGKQGVQITSEPNFCYICKEFWSCLRFGYAKMFQLMRNNYV